MKRELSIINLAGVCLLALLCGVQWTVNRRLNLARADLMQLLSRKIDEAAAKDETIRGGIADLDEFRSRLEQSDAELKREREKSGSLAAERDRIGAERDALKGAVEADKAALAKWSAAVSQRDEALKEAESQLQKLAADRNDAVEKFNDLAAKFNAEVGELKKANDAIGRLTAERDEAIGKYNDLAAKYNQLVKQVESAATKPKGMP